MRNTSGWAKAVIACVLAGLLAACSGQELYRNVDEREANEMIAVLMRAGIDSQKSPGDDELFTVYVAQDDFARSVDLLRQNGLPREQYESLGSVFRKEGFTSSSLAERARLVYGISQELSHTISEFDGVIESRVHLALPEADPLTGAANPPSASVFVKYREGMDLPAQTAAIKALVTNSIEGLDYDNVSIAMTEARPLPTPPAQTTFDRLGTVFSPIAAIIGLGLLSLGGFQLFTRRRRSAQAEQYDDDILIEPQSE